MSENCFTDSFAELLKKKGRKIREYRILQSLDIDYYTISGEQQFAVLKNGTV